MRLRLLRSNIPICSGCANIPNTRHLISSKLSKPCYTLSGQTAKQLVQRTTGSFIRRPLTSMVVQSVSAAETAVADKARAGTQVSHKVELLRQEMAKADHGKGVQAYIIPTEDPHMSEYAPSSDERRHFISDFTGSAGTAVVTTDTAALWTDGRYFLQAEQQLGPGWTLMKGGTPGCPEIPDWLATNLPEGGRVGIDPFLHTVDSAKQLTNKLQEAGKQLVPVMEGNLVDKVWGDARPAAPSGPIRIHKIEHAGRSVQDKLSDMRKAMQVGIIYQVCESSCFDALLPATTTEQQESAAAGCKSNAPSGPPSDVGAGALLVTAVDEVAWLLNLRGGDVSHNPVFTSYVLLQSDSAALYVDTSKVTDEVASHLKAAQVEVQPYEQLVQDVQKVAQGQAKIWADPSKVNLAISTAARSANEESAGKTAQRKRPRTDNGGADAEAMSQHASKLFIEKSSPVALAKAIKNKAELEGMQEAHLRDAVALCGLLAFLEKEIGAGHVMTEVEVDEELQARRRAQPGYIEASFPTIAVTHHFSGFYESRAIRTLV